MRFSVRALVASAVLVCSTPAFATEHRIALVDVQRCILETHEGKRAKKDLQDALTKSELRLKGKAEDIEKKKRDLMAKRTMLSEQELMRRQEELMRQEQELQQLVMDLQQDAAEKEELLTQRIYNKVAAIVKQVALEEKLEIVIVRSEMLVLYADPRLDLTNRIIVRYDKKHS
jgi:outer membrane protein